MTCNDLEALLAELALGTLDEAERRAAALHASECPRCHSAGRAAVEAATLFAAAAPARVPPRTLRDRLLASAARPGRHALEDLVARVFDLDHAAAQRVLALADEPSGWRAGPLPGMERLRFEPGPACADARAELLRFAPGARVPRHGHGGAETVVVLEGGFTGDDGEHHGPGERLEASPAVKHGFRCDEEGCLVASLLFGGLRIAW